jgi:DNA-binding transcriptional LysR family regulator
MELRQLRYFVAIAQRRHFTAAAEAIGVAQPALSQQIRLLERELGVQLFDRSGRRIRLTPAGEALLIRAERILIEVANAQSELAEYAGAVRGRVVVGTLPSLAEHQLPPLVAAFHVRHPGLELVLREERTARLLELLAAGEVDLALLHHATTAANATPTLTLEPLFTEELVAAVGAGHPLAIRLKSPIHGGFRGPPLPLADLRDEDFILTKSGSAIRDTIIAACAIAGFAPHIAFESGAAATVRALAAAGLGVAILPRSEAQIAPQSLIAITLTPQLTRTVALAWPTARRHPPATAAFLALAREALRRVVS